MGLLDSLLGGRGGGGGDLGDRVIAMRQQGIDDSTIIQTLQQQGVQMPDIQNALMQADIKMRVAGAPAPPQGGPPQMPPQAEMPPGAEMPPAWGQPQGWGQMPQGQMPPAPGWGGEMEPSPMAGPEMMPGSPEMGVGPAPMTPPPGYGGQDISVLSEKIDEVVDRMNEMEKESTDLKSELADLKEIVADLKGKYVHIQEESAVKLEEYSKDLESVGAHIKALERVLQRVFSATAQNMRELSEIVKTMKGNVGPVQEEPKPKKKSPLVSE